MNHSKLNVFIIILFGVYYLTQNSFVNSPKTILSEDEEEEKKILLEKKTKCIEEIDDVFLSNGNTNLDPKFYVKQAFLNLRISHIPEYDTFTFVSNTFGDLASSLHSYQLNYNIASNAKAYYEFIYPFIVIDERNMEDPYQFCERYNLSNPEKSVERVVRDASISRAHILDNPTSEELKCMNELYLAISVNENKEKVIKYIYEAVVLEETSESSYAHKYIKKLVSYLKPTSAMKLPSDFCGDRYKYIPKNEIAEAVQQLQLI